MNYLNDPQRKRVMKQVLDATTLIEVEAASAALESWMALHPDDQGMEDGYEQLALIKDGLLFEAEHSTTCVPMAKAS